MTFDQSERNTRKALESYLRDRHLQGALSTSVVKEAIAKAIRIRHQYDRVYYIAGALTGMTDEVKDRYARTSQLIATIDGVGQRSFGYAPHLHGTDPILHPSVTPREVREIDFLFAAVIPDMHINFLHPIAHGNAVEQGWAEQMGIPALYITPATLRLSRLIKGMSNIAGVIEYESFDRDAIPQIARFLRLEHDEHLH